MEIEAKIKVESLSPVGEKLKSLGAEFRADIIQRDTYFDASSALVKSDRGLRLRRQVIDGAEEFILTYKGAKQAGKFKSRTEIEVTVADFGAMSELLAELGYEKTLEFEKKRALWSFWACDICLDKLERLGSFVEVEGPSEETINEVLEKIGLAECDHISKTYSEMIKERHNPDVLRDRGIRQM